MRRLDAGTRLTKNEMEIGDENCHITDREMVDKRKRWEDDINEFLKFVEEETENLTESSNQINKTWNNTAKDRGRWALLEENYARTSEERHENNARREEILITGQRGMYVNGVRLSEK